MSHFLFPLFLVKELNYLYVPQKQIKFWSIFLLFIRTAQQYLSPILNYMSGSRTFDTDDEDAFDKFAPIDPYALSYSAHKKCLTSNMPLVLLLLKL